MTEGRTNFLLRALRWLQAGYPEGVPPKDRIPLIALLGHRLSASELDEIVAILIDTHAFGEDGIDRADVAQVIEQVSTQAPSAEDMTRVATRLAAAGWPLSSSSAEDGEPDSGLDSGPASGSVSNSNGAFNSGSDGASDSVASAAKAESDGESGPQRSAFLRAVIGWLTAGYPKGVPTTDYIPLLALLRRRLSDDEVAWVSQRLIAEGGGTFDRADVGVLITKLTDEMPTDADIDRVRAHVESAGQLMEPPNRP